MCMPKKAKPAENIGKPGPRRGRPVVLPAAARRERILDALEQVYRAADLDGVTMDRVARQAGMSKRTVYATFGDRTALLLGYLERLGQNMVLSAEAPGFALSTEARLRRLLIAEPRDPGYGLPLDILRVLIAETARRPEIGRDFVTRILDRNRALVRAELERARQHGQLQIADVDAATELLLDMVRPCLLETLLDARRLPGVVEVERRVDLALAVFGRAHAPASPPPG